MAPVADLRPSLAEALAADPLGLAASGLTQNEQIAVRQRERNIQRSRESRAAMINGTATTWLPDPSFVRGEPSHASRHVVAVSLTTDSVYVPIPSRRCAPCGVVSYSGTCQGCGARMA